MRFRRVLDGVWLNTHRLRIEKTGGPVWLKPVTWRYFDRTGGFIYWLGVEIIWGRPWRQVLRSVRGSDA